MITIGTLLILGGIGVFGVVLGLCRLARRPQPGARHARPEVLVIDDNASVRDVVRLGLEQDQYKVHLFSDGEAALEFFRERHREISAVLVDYVMPRMSGAEVFDELQRINSTVPVILITGFCDDARKSERMVSNVAASLVKPFKLQELLDLVRVVISHAEVRRSSKQAVATAGVGTPDAL